MDEAKLKPIYECNDFYDQYGQLLFNAMYNSYNCRDVDLHKIHMESLECLLAKISAKIIVESVESLGYDLRYAPYNPNVVSMVIMRAQMLWTNFCIKFSNIGNNENRYDDGYVYSLPDTIFECFTVMKRFEDIDIMADLHTGDEDENG